MRSAIFFDFDDTLHDFGRAYDQAFTTLARYVLASRPGELTPEALHRRCAPDWARIWESFMEGRLDEHALWAERMALVFQVAGVTADVAMQQTARDHYVQTMEDSLQPYADVGPALQVAKALDQHPVLAVLTNGVAGIQESRLRRLGFWEPFDFVLVSGALGFGKPDPRFFTEALARAGVQPERAVMIGDNPATDIGGAKKSGILAVWVNRGGGVFPSGYPQPDATVADLENAVAAAAELLHLRKGGGA